MTQELLPVPELLPKRNNKYLLLRITNDMPSSTLPLHLAWSFSLYSYTSTGGEEPEINIREKMVNDVKDKLVRVLHLLAPLDDILGTNLLEVWFRGII